MVYPPILKYKLLYVDKPIYGRLIASEGLYSLYEDDDALSLGYMTRLKEGDARRVLSGNAFENQNIWAYFEIDNSRQLSKEQKALKADNKLFLNGESVGEFIDPHNESAYMVFLGEHVSGEKLNIEVLSEKYYGIMHVFSFNEEAYHNILNSLSKNQLNITEHSKVRFEGTIDAGEGGNMLLTLPYMDGWKVKVDGHRVEYCDYRDTMIIVPLSGGQHNVEIAFFPPGLIAGLISMLISACLWIMIILLNNKHLTDNKDNFKTNHVLA